MDQSESMGGASTDETQSSEQGVRGAAQKAFRRTREAARDTVQENARKAAESVGGAASAVRRAADDIETDNGFVASLLRGSADSLEKASSAIGEGDISRVMEQVSSFARREPGLFLFASFAAGFALSRIGKGALEQSEPDNDFSSAYDRADGATTTDPAI